MKPGQNPDRVQAVTSTVGTITDVIMVPESFQSPLAINHSKPAPLRPLNANTSGRNPRHSRHSHSSDDRYANNIYVGQLGLICPEIEPSPDTGKASRQSQADGVAPQKPMVCSPQPPQQYGQQSNRRAIHRHIRPQIQMTGYLMLVDEKDNLGLWMLQHRGNAKVGRKVG